MFSSGKAVPQQLDTKIVISKINELSAKWLSPMSKTVPLLSGPSSPDLPFPSGLPSLLEEDKTIAKREE